MVVAGLGAVAARLSVVAVESGKEKSLPPLRRAVVPCVDGVVPFGP
jgi:hypothetical protein